MVGRPANPSPSWKSQPLHFFGGIQLDGRFVTDFMCHVLGMLYLLLLSTHNSNREPFELCSQATACTSHSLESPHWVASKTALKYAPNMVQSCSGIKQSLAPSICLYVVPEYPSGVGGHVPIQDQIFYFHLRKQ